MSCLLNYLTIKYLNMVFVVLYCLWENSNKVFKLGAINVEIYFIIFL